MSEESDADSDTSAPSGGLFGWWKGSRAETAQARSTIGGVMALQVGANGLGVFVVAMYVLVLFPSGSEQNISLTVRAVATYAAVLLGVGVPLNVILLRRAVRWVRDGVAPTAAQRRLVFWLPLIETLPSLVSWGIGAVIFGVINQSSQRVAIGIVLAGVVTSALLYLLLEAHFRPVFALAMRTATLPEGRRDVLPRLMLTWALGSAVPIALLGVAPMLNDQFEARRMPWIAGFALIGGGAVMVVGAVSVARPINRLRDALWEIERGRLDLAVPVDDLGELGRLASGVNDLVAGLRERERLREQFGRQVGLGAFSVTENGTLGLDTIGSLRDVTVLFVDLEGFTRYSEHRPPDEVVTLLNRFFEVVVTTVNREGGWVNKFEGDAALCIFGAPDPDGDHAAKALSAAARMRTDLARTVHAGEALSAGIGVASGSVIAGFVGTHERHEYTVIGDCVNLASRLCDLAKSVPGRALVTRDSWQAARCPDGWNSFGRTPIRGRAEPADVMALDLGTTTSRRIRPIR